jgi:hypothetical protein
MCSFIEEWMVVDEGGEEVESGREFCLQQHGVVVCCVFAPFSMIVLLQLQGVIEVVDEVESRTFVESIAFSSEGMDLWRRVGVLLFFCGKMTPDRSVSCSSVKVSSHVMYTPISSLTPRSLSCRISKSAAMDDRCAPNQLSCPRLLTTQTNRTCRVTAPVWREKNEGVLEFEVVVSRQPWRMSRRRGRVNVAPVLPARRTTLSNWRRGRRVP